MTKTQIAIILALGFLTLVAFLGVGFIIFDTVRSIKQQGPVAEAVPTIPVPTATELPTYIPTWTPVPSPTAVPTPDLRIEVATYLDKLDPLLDADQELWEERDEFGNNLTFEYCINNGETLRPTFRDFEARQAEINGKIADIVPPKLLEHAHQTLVAAIRQEATGYYYNFKGCVEANTQWWDAADIEFAYAHDKRTAAFDEIREVLNDLGIEWERDL